MNESLELIVRLVATAVLIAINALYVFHEFAFVALKPGQIRRIDTDPSPRGRLLSRTIHNLDHYIAVDQLGITASSLAVGWIGQPVVTEVISNIFGELGGSSGTWLIVSAVIAFAFLTGTQMIVGELMPKTYALRNAEATAHRVAAPVEWTAKIFHPFVALLNGIGLAIVRLLGFSGESGGHAREMRAEELVAIVYSSARAGTVSADPRTLRRLLHFSDLRAHDLMVPRPDIVALIADASYEDVLAVAQEHRYDRYPVYEETLDDVVGVISVKSLMAAGLDQPAMRGSAWRQLVVPLPVLPGTASIEAVIRSLEQSGQQMVLLVDEYGATDGIVTVADIAAQLIEGPDEIHADSVADFRVEGHASLALLEAELDIDLGSDERDVESIAGLVMDELGAIPEVGATVQGDGWRIEVTRMMGHRILEVRIVLNRNERTDPPDASASAS